MNDNWLVAEEWNGLFITETDFTHTHIEIGLCTRLKMWREKKLLYIKSAKCTEKILHTFHMFHVRVCVKPSRNYSLTMFKLNNMKIKRNIKQNEQMEHPFIYIYCRVCERFILAYYRFWFAIRNPSQSQSNSIFLFWAAQTHTHNLNNSLYSMILIICHHSIRRYFLKKRNKIRFYCSLAPLNHFEHAQTAFGMKRIKILFISSTHLELTKIKKKTTQTHRLQYFCGFLLSKSKRLCDYVL